MSRKKSSSSACSIASRSAPAFASDAIKIFRALASQARICIVMELSKAKEKCVCDFVNCCGLGWSTVSHHLSILRNAGIVSDEKRGQQIFYRLTLPCVTEVIHCLQNDRKKCRVKTICRS